MINAAWLVDWLIVMGVCSVSEDSKEARPHYGVPHTKEFLPGKTELHGLCFVGLRCERGRRVLSFLAEKNSQPTHEIMYTRLVPTKITNYSCARVIVNHPPDHHDQRQRIHRPLWVLEDGSYPSTCGSNGFLTAVMEGSITSRQQRQQRLPTTWSAKTVSSKYNSESVVVLYRGGPI